MSAYAAAAALDNESVCTKSARQQNKTFKLRLSGTTAGFAPPGAAVGLWPASLRSELEADTQTHRPGPADGDGLVGLMVVRIQLSTCVGQV